MKKYISLTFVLSVVINLSALTYGQQAAPVGEEPPPPYTGDIFQRPPSPITQFELKKIEEVIEVDTLIHYELHSHVLKIRMEPPTGWFARNSQESSITFIYRTAPEAQFSYSVYNIGDFLPDIEATSLKGYVEGLKLKYKDTPDISIEFHNEDTEYIPEGESSYLNTPKGRITFKSKPNNYTLSRVFKVIEYTISQKLDEENYKKTKYSDYFLEIGDFLFTATYQAPENKYKGFKKNFDSCFLKMATIGEVPGAADDANDSKEGESDDEENNEEPE